MVYGSAGFCRCTFIPGSGKKARSLIPFRKWFGPNFIPRKLNESSVMEFKRIGNWPLSNIFQNNLLTILLFLLLHCQCKFVHWVSDSGAERRSSLNNDWNSNYVSFMLNSYCSWKQFNAEVHDVIAKRYHVCIDVLNKEFEKHSALSSVCQHIRLDPKLQREFKFTLLLEFCCTKNA